MSKFTHLHVHSHYSLLDGLSKIPDLVKKTKEIGCDSIAITDHGNLYGAIEFFKEAKKQGIKSILGSEIYIAFEGMHQQRPGIDDKRYHLILLVKDSEGYENLVKIITKAHLEGFYYKPRVDEEFLRQHSKGLIALSACLSGKISRLILSNKIKEAEMEALKYQDIFGKGNYYLEIQNHPNIEPQEKVTKELIDISKKTGIPLVATADSHYLNKDDAEAQDILMLINTGADKEDPERLSMKSDDFSLKTPEEMEKIFKDVPEAISNTQVIANACNFEMVLGQIKLPEFKLPDKRSADEYLRDLCFKLLKEKDILAEAKEIKKRLEYELDTIKDSGFASYFLIVQDFVDWAKKHHIVVGPGRGSVGGSLVAYVLGITSIDPMRYNLLFERFLNPGRATMPDIDLDFADHRRDEVIKYVSEKYGKNRVAQIITFGTMAARAVIRDVGRALGYEYGFCDMLAKMIPFGHTLDDSLKKVSEFRNIYKTDEKAKKLIDLAKKLEGVVRHASTHACGVVISAEPLDKLVPLQNPTQNEDTIITQYEMHGIEDLGLLKMDFLGLKNLSIIEDTLQRIYAITGKNIDIEKIPLDDKKVFKLLQNGDCTGVFQLESDGMRRYLKQLKPTEFEDIIAMVALYRPGPMELIPEYIERKHGRKEITYLHEKLKPILQNTYGVCIYQEQLMRIAQDLANFTLADADILRKAVGKKIESLLLEQREKMVNGMIKNGIKKDVAIQLWEWVLPFARYGFNRSHSAAYATISYQTAWLKTNYPMEFMSALLTAERNDIERCAFIIAETRKMGIEVLPPNINESFSFFSVVPEKNQIRFGLSAIKNVGEGAIKTIIAERKANGLFISIQDFARRASANDLNRKSLESLTKTGAFDNFAERNEILANIDRLLEISKENRALKENGQKGLFDSSGSVSEITLEKTDPAAEEQLLKWEKELLGLYVTSHPLQSIKNILEHRTTPITKLELNQQKRARIGGIISSVKKIITKSGKPMLFLNLEDLHDKIEVVVFPSITEKFYSLFNENNVVFITGRMDKRNGERKFICDGIERIITKQNETSAIN